MPRVAESSVSMRGYNTWKWKEFALKSGLIVDPEFIPDNLKATKQTSTSSLVGVSLDWLKTFSESLLKFPGLSNRTQHIVEDIIAPCTENAGCRMIDMVPQDQRGTPTQYICHFWGNDFHSAVKALVTDFERRCLAHVRVKCAGRPRPPLRRLEDERRDSDVVLSLSGKKYIVGYYVWIDVVMLRQCAHIDQAPVDLTVLNRLLNVIGRTLVLLDPEALVLKRTWCCYEIWTTLKLGRSLFAHRVSSATVDGDEASSVVEGGQVFFDEDATHLPSPVLAETLTAVVQDKTMLMASFNSDITPPRNKAQSLQAISKTIAKAASDAIRKSVRRGDLVEKVCQALCICKAYSRHEMLEMCPTSQEIYAMQTSLHSVIENHYSAESSRLVTGPDAEGEVWASMLFLSHIFEEQREETFWTEEFRRLANVAQKQFASRFSQSYVEDLMRKAGTSDDMKRLANYVRSRCRYLNHRS